MPHQVDNFGNAIDPKLRELEVKLSDLAAWFRGAINDPEQRSKVVQEYQTILNHLYQLGWDGRLDMQDELPDEYMPKRYIQKNSPYRFE